MKQFIIVLALTMLAHPFSLAAAPSGGAGSATLPDKNQVKIYLLLGQSNMAGRGIPENEDRATHPRVFVFNRSNQWELAVEPLTLGEKGKTPGVGPGLAFGKAIADANPNLTIGLVPCAVGGTQLRRWTRGTDLYSNVVARARAAAPAGSIAGILWHQGEGDAGSKTNADSYGIRLTKMIADIRADLNMPNLPFVVGQIGEFNYGREGDPLPFARELNETLAKIPQTVPHAGCALSKGLGHKGDQLHFSSAAERELGRRYAQEMLKLEKSPRQKKAESERKLLQK